MSEIGHADIRRHQSQAGGIGQGSQIGHDRILGKVVEKKDAGT